VSYARAFSLNSCLNKPNASEGSDQARLKNVKLPLGKSPLNILRVFEMIFDFDTKFGKFSDLGPH